MLGECFCGTLRVASRQESWGHSACAASAEKAFQPRHQPHRPATEPRLACSAPPSMADVRTPVLESQLVPIGTNRALFLPKQSADNTRFSYFRRRKLSRRENAPLRFRTIVLSRRAKLLQFVTLPPSLQFTSKGADASVFGHVPAYLFVVWQSPCGGALCSSTRSASHPRAGSLLTPGIHLARILNRRE